LTPARENPADGLLANVRVGVINVNMPTPLMLIDAAVWSMKNPSTKLGRSRVLPIAVMETARFTNPNPLIEPLPD